jgi:hypothetical protein
LKWLRRLCPLQTVQRKNIPVISLPLSVMRSLDYINTSIKSQGQTNSSLSLSLSSFHSSSSLSLSLCFSFFVYRGTLSPQKQETATNAFSTLNKRVAHIVALSIRSADENLEGFFLHMNIS